MLGYLLVYNLQQVLWQCLKEFPHTSQKILAHIGKIQNIENPIIDYKIFNNLAYGQWTLKEIETGESWENISNNFY